MYHPDLCSSKFSSLPTLWYSDMLEVSLFKRMFFLIDLWVVDRRSQNIRGCWLKKAIVPFVCVVVTQVVIFGVNCGLNPVDLKTRTQPLRRVTSDSSFPAFCPRTPRRGWVRGSAGLNLLRPTGSHAPAAVYAMLWFPCCSSNEFQSSTVVRTDVRSGLAEITGLIFRGREL